MACGVTIIAAPTLVGLRTRRRRNARVCALMLSGEDPGADLSLKLTSETMLRDDLSPGR